MLKTEKNAQMLVQTPAATPHFQVLPNENNVNQIYIQSNSLMNLGPHYQMPGLPGQAPLGRTPQELGWQRRAIRDLYAAIDRPIAEQIFVTKPPLAPIDGLIRMKIDRRKSNKISGNNNTSSDAIIPPAKSHDTQKTETEIIPKNPFVTLELLEKIGQGGQGRVYRVRRVEVPRKTIIDTAISTENNASNAIAPAGMQPFRATTINTQYGGGPTNSVHKLNHNEPAASDLTSNNIYNGKKSDVNQENLPDLKNFPVGQELALKVVPVYTARARDRALREVKIQRRLNDHEEGYNKRKRARQRQARERRAGLHLNGRNSDGKGEYFCATDKGRKKLPSNLSKAFLEKNYFFFSFFQNNLQIIFAFFNDLIFAKFLLDTATSESPGTKFIEDNNIISPGSPPASLVSKLNLDRCGLISPSNDMTPNTARSSTSTGITWKTTTSMLTSAYHNNSLYLFFFFRLEKFIYKLFEEK